jgi:hypothetical protein
MCDNEIVKLVGILLKLVLLELIEFEQHLLNLALPAQVLG